MGTGCIFSINLLEVLQKFLRYAVVAKQLFHASQSLAPDIRQGFIHMFGSGWTAMCMAVANILCRLVW